MGFLGLWKTRGERIGALVDECRDAASAGDEARFLQSGEQLVALDDPQGYALLGPVLAAAGRTRDAIALLDRGTRAHPRDWEIWLRLADVRSDLGDHARAAAAYAQASAHCPPDVRVGIVINHAVSLSVLAEHAQALAILDNQPNPADDDTWAHLRGLAVSLLCKLGRFEEAAGRATWLIAQTSKKELSPKVLAELHAARGTALFRDGDGDREAALAAARRALAISEGEPTALALLRLIEARRSDVATVYRLIVRSRDSVAFYDVIADDPKEAFELAARLEPDARPSSDDDCKRIGPAREPFKGVLALQARILLPRAASA
jgi:tetratricopeptide (TPR) repeat protein